MDLPRWLPRPAAWASALGLYVFAAGVGPLLGFVIPLLFALMRHWPRLAWAGLIVAWLAPIALAAGLHHVVGGLFGARRRDSALGDAPSWWAGFVAWATIVIVTMTTAFLQLLVDPPPLPDPDATWNVAALVIAGVSGPTRSLLWLVLAALVYELEQRARDAE